MLLLPRSVRVYVATYPVSLRKSFDGLCNEVRCVLGHDPMSGHVFIFINRRKTQVKLLIWTRGGFTIVHKRLEKGRFAFTKQLGAGVKSVQIGAHELSMLLEGLQQKTTRSAARWEPGIDSPQTRQSAIPSHWRVALDYEMIRMVAVMTMPPSTACPAPQTDADERRGDVLSMVRELLGDRRDDAVVNIVTRLVRENEDLKRQLAERYLRRCKGEGVSSDQLKLFLAAIEPEPDDQREQTNEALREVASDAVNKGGEDEKAQDPSQATAASAADPT